MAAAKSLAVLIMPYALLSSSFVLVLLASKFYQDFDIIWGIGKVKILNHGEVVNFYLGKDTGSGFQSKNEYLFGKIDMQFKLVPGNSAGTVTSYYVRRKLPVILHENVSLFKSKLICNSVLQLSSQGSTWDEIDFEFLGNFTGDPYIFYTNVITQGNGDREQQFYPWFDPTSDFHTYSIIWNPKTIVFYVDSLPIREFKNLESINIPHPKNQPMRIHSSLWNADDWATRGGLVKTDWTKAPFTASCRNFNAKACTRYPAGPIISSPCPSNSSSSAWMKIDRLDETSREKLKWVQKNYMIYNYCTVTKRFPKGLPPVCAIATSAS